MARGVVGRSAELGAIDEFLAATVGGPAALLVEGEPGIGKTTLWRAATERASDREFLVLSSRPAASEARLSFAGLADLLGPVDEPTGLPERQREALDAALLRGGSAPDRRAVSTAFLSVLRAASASRPVVVAVDDVQWVDTPTWHALEFALRRLTAEPIGFLAARRLAPEERAPETFEQLLREREAHRLRLGPLSMAALHEVLKSHLDRTFPRPTLVRIERTSGGNPFFALELARALPEDVGPGPLPVPDDLAALLEARLRRLPPACRRALVAAAALSQPSLDLLDRGAIELAEEAGVVSVDERGRVDFDHPLLASAVYRAASARTRREVHRELAGRVSDPEEQARHLALGTDQPDEQVAAALADAARAARTRGATDGAIELSELACRFAPADPRRRFELAQALAAGGDPQRAGAVLRQVVDEAKGPLRARARVTLAFTFDWEGTDEAVDLCERALEDATGEPALLAEIHAVTSRLCDEDVGRKVAHADAAPALAETAGPGLHAYALLAKAEADFYAGRGIRDELFAHASELEDAAAEPGPEHLGALNLHTGLRLSERLLSVLQLYAGELEPARERLERELRAASGEGDEAQVVRTMRRLAALELDTGSWDAADDRLRELGRLVERTGQSGVGCHGLAAAARLHALRGRPEAARAAAEQALAQAVADRHEWLTAECLAALGFVALAAGELEAARAALERADAIERRFGVREPSLLRHHGDLVETLVWLGELERADAVLTSLESPAPSVWGRAVAARCRGLVLAVRGDLDAAGAAFERAAAERTFPFELARTLLEQGRLHRRRNERLRARDALLECASICDQLGAQPWSEKARGELRRLGLRKGPPDELTPTEEQIAALAAAGLTNREIADRAYVSTKTVEANLARVYRKLGIHSRAELGGLLAGRKPSKT